MFERQQGIHSLVLSEVEPDTPVADIAVSIELDVALEEFEEQWHPVIGQLHSEPKGHQIPLAPQHVPDAGG